MKERILCNARIVLENEVISGSLALRGQRIQAIDSGPASTRRSDRTDCAGEYLIPGLIDVHTDHIERQFAPRNGVYWPSRLSAAMASDALLCGCGVATVLDSLCAEAFPTEEAKLRMFNDCIQAVSEGERLGLFRSRHLLHLRCETADPKASDFLQPHLDNPLVQMVSLMDHTPGQRQYRDAQKFREYYAGQGWTDEEFAEVCARLKRLQAMHAADQRAHIIRQCRQRGVRLASHDDADESHVRQAQEEGVAISEFPTTLTAAKAAHAAGMDVVMGAPNIVLGGSHAGNVSALEVFRAGLLDVLSSDYTPASLLLAPFQLHAEEEKPLPECVALVTANPARMLGLTDRGRLSEGLLADVLRVRLVETRPIITQVFVNGAPVLAPRGAG
ncbi:MAG: alpha-D-ribose 1-methylphosphonate 5-triphosphate diphosphatase [Desulfovibrionales bacterium]|nr:alpha-D-ribose 1-methylphosphonate 5-triphosphate diphosphatase [Desulfovibrionales bacterium]